MESGWTQTGQHTHDIAALNQRGICTERMFAELVSYMSVDINAIPRGLDGGFGFCRSACALERLGSIRHGLDFIRNAMRTLHLSLHRRSDIDDFIRGLRADGLEVGEVDWELGEGFAEMVVDLPPFSGRGEPHIR